MREIRTSGSMRGGELFAAFVANDSLPTLPGGVAVNAAVSRQVAARSSRNARCCVARPRTSRSERGGRTEPTRWSLLASAGAARTDDGTPVIWVVARLPKKRGNGNGQAVRVPDS